MARPRRILALAAAVTATALAACSLLTGLDADYKLQANSEAEGGRDGEVPPDGNGETGADTSVGFDGGRDATTDARFCEQHRADPGLAFCCDFETAAGKCPWAGEEKTNGTFAEEDGVGRYGSRGLHATVTRGPASAYVRSELAAPVAFNSIEKHVLSFAFAVKTKSTLYGAAIGALGFNGTPFKVTGVSVYQAAGKDAIDVSDPPGMLGGTKESVALGEWRRATITMLRNDAGVYTTTTMVESEVGIPSQVDSRGGFDGGAGMTEILFGAFFTSSETGGRVETVIDDILLTQTK
jgi:hypothetical protein